MTQQTVPHSEPGQPDEPHVAVIPRLCLGTLADVVARPEVDGPAVDPAQVTVGIVHLGAGAFHRAHQAVFTEDAAAATGETCWGILGVTQRSASVVDQLRPQDGLYGVLTTGADGSGLRIVASLREVAFPGDDTGRVLAALAAPTTHVVTLTVTEKGYRLSADGRLELSDPDLQADLAALAEELSDDGAVSAPQAAQSPVGLLVRGLVRRFREGGAPLTVVCCDNMVDNGRVVEGLVREAVEVTQAVPKVAATGLLSGVADWLTTSVTFPCTMVDRIVPATTEAHRAEAAALAGVRDEGLVVGEPFAQWVIEDRFAGPRPAWERAGATLTDDVAPYEQAKLRMLNGTHSLLAYLGSLKGLPLIADAVTDPELSVLARRLLLEDVVPTLQPLAGLDLVEYAESVLRRFANPSTGHTTIQVAMDGSTKLPIRLLGTVADRLAAGAVPQAAVTAVAGWIAFVARGQTLDGVPLALDDPRAEQLRAATAGLGTGADLVGSVLALREVFPEQIARDLAFRAALTERLDELLARFRC